MKLSKVAALMETYKMWDWIARETLKRKRMVSKLDYVYDFPFIYVYNDYYPKSICWLCQFTFDMWDHLSCRDCPLYNKWGIKEPEDHRLCTSEHSLYDSWANSWGWLGSYICAREIADRVKKELNELGYSC